MPYSADIPGNFYPGRKMYVSGLSKKRAKQFVLQLYDGNSDIALQINPRFLLKVYIKIKI